MKARHTDTQVEKLGSRGAAHKQPVTSMCLLCAGGELFSWLQKQISGGSNLEL